MPGRILCEPSGKNQLRRLPCKLFDPTHFPHNEIVELTATYILCFAAHRSRLRTVHFQRRRSASSALRLKLTTPLNVTDVYPGSTSTTRRFVGRVKLGSTLTKPMHFLVKSARLADMPKARNPPPALSARGGNTGL